MQTADEQEGLDIKPGYYVTGKKCKYIVKVKIGQGGYGAVYKVSMIASNGKEFAMKAEKKGDTNEHTKLSMEKHILQNIKALKSGVNHYAEMVDKAKKTKFSMIVMTLLGENLMDLKKGFSPPTFTLGTGLAVAIQTCEAIEQLHILGFIHRDVKPANFAIGLGNKERTVYILDFGISRKFVNEKVEIKAPRSTVGFKGTIRFASLNCLKGQEQSPKDDLESWLYLVIDCCSPEGLPWKLEKEKEPVLAMKINARTEKGMKELFGSLPQQHLVKMLTYIDKLAYADANHIDYEFLYQEIKQCAKTANVSMEDMFDWQSEEKLTPDCPKPVVTQSTESHSMINQIQMAQARSKNTKKNSREKRKRVARSD